jgi:hypothetical protein
VIMDFFRFADLFDGAFVHDDHPVGHDRLLRTLLRQ